jgi:pilus assembly protein Flp/PilA
MRGDDFVGEQRRFRRFLADEDGATAIEYALICGIMSVALIAVAGVGGALSEVYEKVREIVGALGGGSGDGDGGGGG